METIYEILRLEQGLDRNGQPEVFVQFEIADETVGVFSKGMWFRGNPAQLIIDDLADNNQIDSPKVNAYIQARLNALVVQKKIDLQREGIVVQ